MSGRRFLITYIFLVALGLFGWWLGSRTSDPSDLKTWLGFLIVLGVTIGLPIAFCRDLGKPESERRADWEHAKAKGRLKYVTGQVGLVVLVYGVASLSFMLFDVYKRGEPWTVALNNLREQVAYIVLAAVIHCVWALTWWHVRKKKDERLI